LRIASGNAENFTVVVDTVYFVKVFTTTKAGVGVSQYFKKKLDFLCFLGVIDDFKVPERVL